MPTLYIKKELYNEIVRKGYDINEFVERTAWEELERLKKGEGAEVEDITKEKVESNE